MFTLIQNAKTVGQDFIAQEVVQQMHTMLQVQLLVFMKLGVNYSAKEWNVQLW